MKKMIILSSLFFSLTLTAFPCTTFFLNKNGQLIFGRNYDWVTGNGMVCTNLKGMAKTSAPASDGATISWVSQYGSLTFNQYGKEFPTGGMNEKGLVVELMWLDGTRYPNADTRPAVGVLQWIQYQLDNCSSVEEVIASDKKLRISSKDNAPLHYLVADAKGNVATIEFFDGKLNYHQGPGLPFPVLTNNSYEESISQAGSAIRTAGANSPSFTNNSIDRFAKACRMVNQFQQTDIKMPVVDYAFSILDNVAQGDHTKWSIVYDLSNKKIYFKTFGYTQVKNMSFSSFDFRCSTMAKAWDMNQATKGDIAALFVPYSQEMNRRIVEKSFEESASEIRAGEQEKRQTWEYAGGITCSK
jgi:penicillin V acylase-like amidase (Ntn superfamily)